MTAYFIVRARITDAIRKEDFDRWYQEEHLPDARAAFDARRAWRGWSAVDASVHYAYYSTTSKTRAPSRVRMRSSAWWRSSTASGVPKSSAAATSSRLSRP
jgi:hypothetical protein